MSVWMTETLPLFTISSAANMNTASSSLPLFTVSATATRQPYIIDSLYIPGLNASAQQEALGNLTEILPLLVSVGTVTSYSGRASNALPHLTLTAVIGQNAGNDLPTITLISAGNIDPEMTAGLNLPAMEGVGYAGALSSASSMGLPGLTLSAAGQIDNLGTVAQPLPSLLLNAHGVSDGMGILIRTLPRLAMSGEGTITAIVSASIRLPKLTLDISASFGKKGSVAGVLPLFDIDATGYFDATGNAAITLPLKELLSGILNGVFSTVVMNTNTTAVTEYSQYPFNSFAKFNGVFIGASTTGIYTLSGDSDNGTHISASFRTGPSTYGTMQLKRIYNVYLFGRLHGRMDVTLTTEETDSYQYRTSGEGDGKLRTERVKTAKGPRSTTWDVEIGNVHGADFDMEVADLVSAVTTRRVGRR